MSRTQWTARSAHCYAGGSELVTGASKAISMARPCNESSCTWCLCCLNTYRPLATPQQLVVALDQAHHLGSHDHSRGAQEADSTSEWSFYTPLQDGRAP
jgi:hypothetical protein